MEFLSALFQGIFTLFGAFVLFFLFAIFVTWLLFFLLVRKIKKRAKEVLRQHENSESGRRQNQIDEIVIDVSGE